MNILDITQLYYDISLMQGGINSDIGENGGNLSGGQQKRIHLSRTLY
jgi:ABC-type bacteriocin/lantibiotic exporter with double-glycine peptidase domain